MNNTPQCVLIKLLKDQREKNFKKKKIFFSKENKLTFAVRGGLAQLAEGIFISNEDKMSRYQ